MERAPSQDEIFWIRYYISCCMQLAMSKAQAALFLAEQFNIPQSMTQTVWEMLEEEEYPGAEGYYNEMVELLQHDVTNFLFQLRQQNGDGSSDLLHHSPF